MKYVSTRNTAEKITASQAIIRGLAPDGGLYVPEEIPQIDAGFIAALKKMDYRGRALAVLRLYLEEFSDEELTEIIRASYADNFDAPEAARLAWLDPLTGCLELWHGPTCAFKDMALQIMPRLLTASLRKNGEERTVCILVATSGDTGKAALEGFRDVPGTRIMVFYPRDGVSEVQNRQMITQGGENVGVVAVRGNFDDAQTGVKRIFADRAFAAELDRRGYFLSSANSINWGRLLPQIVYYFSAYCDMTEGGEFELGEEMDFCVPTGNFGDILAGWFAKKMGLPIRKLICASNENRVLTDFFETGLYNAKRPFYLTDSPSMDILVSSNLERLLYYICGAEKTRGFMQALSEEGAYRVDGETLAALREDFAAGCCGREQTGEAIADLWRGGHYLIDTHTAVAMRVLDDYRAASGEIMPATVLSTASPFKFCGAVLRALGREPEADGPALIRELAEYTGVEAPAPLGGLDERAVRFDGVVDCAGMKDAVGRFLS